MMVGKYISGSMVVGDRQISSLYELLRANYTLNLTRPGVWSFLENCLIHIEIFPTPRLVMPVDE